MELNIRLEGKEEIQQFLSIIQLGLLQALEKELISLEEVEGYLFNPYTVEQLENLKIDDRIVNIVRHGCELEDVQSLLPQKFLPTIKDLNKETTKIIASLPKPLLPINKIIKK